MQSRLAKTVVPASTFLYVVYPHGKEGYAGTDQGNWN